jgi:hypothetical protein
MMRSTSLASDVPATESEDIFFMTNLSPRMTGLPMAIWASPRGNARHDVRIKVNMSHGRLMKIDNTAVVAVRPSPRVIAGRLSAEDQRLIAEWIALNASVLVDFWDDKLDTDQFLERLKKLQEK